MSSAAALIFPFNIFIWVLWLETLIAADLVALAADLIPIRDTQAVFRRALPLTATRMLREKLEFLFNPRHETGFVFFGTVGREVGARNDLSADGYENVFVPAVGVLS